MKPSTNNDESENDFIWGGEAIAAELGVEIQQFYNLMRSRALAGYVKRAGHQTLVASRRKLRTFADAE